MNFTSLVFFLFLPITLFLHWITPSRFRWIPLLAASYFFYGFLNPWLLFLIASTTLVSYLCAIGIDKRPALKKIFLILALGATLGLLFVFKYLDFTLSLFVHAGLSISFYPLNLVLPVGISFYTFQTIAYVVDVYRGNAKAEKHIGYFALFISFFPQLVAGPIEKSGNLLPQLRASRSIDMDDFGEGLKYFVSGFLKKIVLADFLAIYVNSVYRDLAMFSGFEILLATFLFGLVIYGDFSGYCDIAFGCAKWLGINLSKNFDRPYLSSSLKEFWNRWHITLNGFFTEYIYIPLGGNRKGRVRKYINIAIVFFISGLWHGASIHFVLWGLIHGALLIIEDLLSPLLEKWKQRRGIKILFIALTYLCVNFVWLFFRVQSVTEIGIAFNRIFTGFASIHSLSFFDPLHILWAILAVGLLIYIPYMPQIKSESDHNYSAISMYALMILVIGLCYFSNYSTGGESSFIYFSF